VISYLILRFREAAAKHRKLPVSYLSKWTDGWTDTERNSESFLFRGLNKLSWHFQINQNLLGNAADNWPTSEAPLCIS